MTSPAQPKEDVPDMPTSTNSQWTPGGTAGYRKYFRYAGNAADVRASDSERSEVADRLSKHYSDGRLDQAEFNDRLDRAMNAKTRAEFAGLFHDLPDLPGETGPTNKSGQQKFDPMKMPASRDGRTRQCGAFRQLALLAAIVITAIVVAHVVMHAWFLWLLIGVVAFFWLRNEQGRRR